MNYKELMHTKTYDEMTEEELAFVLQQKSIITEIK